MLLQKAARPHITVILPLINSVFRHDAKKLGEKRPSSQSEQLPEDPALPIETSTYACAGEQKPTLFPTPFPLCVFVWVSEEQWEPSVWRRCEVLDGVTEYESVCVCVYDSESDWPLPLTTAACTAWRMFSMRSLENDRERKALDGRDGKTWRAPTIFNSRYRATTGQQDRDRDEQRKSIAYTPIIKFRYRSKTIRHTINMNMDVQYKMGIQTKKLCKYDCKYKKAKKYEYIETTKKNVGDAQYMENILLFFLIHFIYCIDTV